jgi:cytochrome c biogenesis protein CcmG, thiol:disulfide interchange protein DsbE
MNGTCTLWPLASMRFIRESLLLVGALPLLACGPGAMPRSLGHPLAGAVAPEFREMATADREVGLPGSPRTKATVIDFWASWCASCQQTLPALDKLYRDRKADGVMVIGVSLDESGDAALLLAQHLHASFPIVLDPGMRLAGSYGVAQVPLTFVVDRRGTVRWIGRSPGDARRAVDVVLDE